MIVAAALEFRHPFRRGTVNSHRNQRVFIG